MPWITGKIEKEVLPSPDKWSLSEAQQTGPTFPPTLLLFFRPSVHLESEVWKTGAVQWDVERDSSSFLLLALETGNFLLHDCGVSVQGCNWLISWLPREIYLACWQACHCGSSNLQSLHLEIYMRKRKWNANVWFFKKVLPFTENSLVLPPVFVPTLPLAPPAPSVCHRERRKRIRTIRTYCTNSGQQPLSLA